MEVDSSTPITPPEHPDPGWQATLGFVSALTLARGRECMASVDDFTVGPLLQIDQHRLSRTGDRNQYWRQWHPFRWSLLHIE